MDQSLNTTASTTDRASRVLRETYSRVQPFISAAKLWDEVLLPDDHKRLGNDVVRSHQSHRGLVGMWVYLRGVTRERAVIELGKKLNFLTAENVEWLLREIGESNDNPEQLVERAVETGDLVLIDQPREAHWQSRRIEIDWDKNSALWEFLWQLSVHAKGDRPIDRLTFGELKNPSYPSKTKYRLVNFEGFPVDLGILIDPAGRGTLKLTLAPERIRVFQNSPNGSLRELTA